MESIDDNHIPEIRPYCIGFKFAVVFAAVCARHDSDMRLDNATG